MSYPINYPTPQGANVQIFSQRSPTTGNFTAEWVKPQGASFVWFTLIGGGAGGGGGDGATLAGGGGGSGSVTNCLVPAFLIPDVLVVALGPGGTGGTVASGYDGNPGGNTFVRYQQKDTSGYILLQANGGSPGSAASNTGGAGGTATTSNYFSAAGFFQSITGQTGAAPGVNLSPSTTTFLSGGATLTSLSRSNYGYSPTLNGFFQIQPIIVGGGGADTGVGGAGCGGGGCNNIGSTTVGGRGGDGLAVIISW